MNHTDLETRLERAATVAAPEVSVVDEVMRRIPPTPPKRATRPFWRRPILATGVATLAAAAAVIAFVVMVAGPSTQLALADVQAAVSKQVWVHVRFDTAKHAEQWTNLRTGELFSRDEEWVVYANRQTNIRLVYWKDSGVIAQDTPVIYGPGVIPERWKPKDAWESIVSPLAQHATTQPTGPTTIVRVADTLNRVPVIRFDQYVTDFAGERYLTYQLWADPSTRLPVRVRNHLQPGERQDNGGKEWETGDYDYPAAGPADLYALGVPRGTPISKGVTTAGADVAPVLEAINRHCDNFIKRYRAVVVERSEYEGRPKDMLDADAVDIIWRDGDRLRAQRHLPALENQNHPKPPYKSGSTTTAILDWASQHEPISQQLMNAEHEYSLRSAEAHHQPKPSYTVGDHYGRPLLASNSWPEMIQWPTRYDGPDFKLIEPNPETPSGCMGIRQGGQGNSRNDYYVDPQNDYVCMKHIDWQKRDGQWIKDREYRLSELHSVAGHVVAGVQIQKMAGDPAEYHVQRGEEGDRLDAVG